jgi:hypothetical protein
VFVDVPEGGGIIVGNVPLAFASDIQEARIYITNANGREMFYASSTVPGTSQFLVGAAALGKLLTTQFSEPFPAATNLLAKAGRLIGSVGRKLVWSHALYPGLWCSTDNFYTFPDDITMIAAPESPRFLLYVSTSKKVYALQGGEIYSTTMSVVNAQGAIPGSMTMVPHEVLEHDDIRTPCPLWAGRDGVPYAGTEDGVIMLNEQFAYPIYEKAAATFMQNNGQNRYIVSGRGGSPSGLMAIDTVVATVYDCGGGAGP